MIELLLEKVATYPALYIACALSGLGIPMPEDVPLLVAGLQLADGRFQVVPTLMVALLGVTTRDTLAWTLGRVLGTRLFEAAWFRKVAPMKKIERARHLLEERGAGAVLIGRFLIGFRAPMFIAAGASRVPLPTFLMWDWLGMAVAVPLMITLGYAFGPPALETAAALVPLARELWLVVVLLGAAWFIWQRSKRRAEPPVT